MRFSDYPSQNIIVTETPESQWVHSIHFAEVHKKYGYSMTRGARARAVLIKEPKYFCVPINYTAIMIGTAGEQP
jgi:hypothetical protein